MQHGYDITPPKHTHDTQGAQRACKEFMWYYEAVVQSLNAHLQDMIDQMQSPYADAYKPWQQALRQLFDGVDAIAHNAPLPDPEGFHDALNTFSFEGALQFLSDLCLCLRVTARGEWLRQFRDDVNTLLFSATILCDGRQHA